MKRNVINFVSGGIVLAVFLFAVVIIISLFYCRPHGINVTNFISDIPQEAVPPLVVALISSFLTGGLLTLLFRRNQLYP